MTCSESGPKGTQGALQIERVEILTNEQAGRLRALWITTVEGFVSRCATEGGQKGLCLLLELDEDELEKVFAEAKGLLPETLVEQLEKPREPPPMGLIFEDDENLRLKKDR